MGCSEKDTWRSILADAGTLFMVMGCFFGLITWMQARDAADQELLRQEITEQSHRYSAMLAQCMNGGALFDKISETAYFCSKPLEIVKP